MHITAALAHQDICRFDILVHQATLMDLAQGGGDLDRNAQETPRLHGSADQPAQRLATGIFEDKDAAAAILH